MIKIEQFLRLSFRQIRSLLILTAICGFFVAGAQSSGVPVEIIKSNQMTLQKVDDSTNLTILEGSVIMKQGKTIFKCNRCVKNDRANTFEAWGNVHINDSDTTNIYADHLRYLTNRQVAYLDGNVKLTDGHAVLTTPSAEYNMATNMATYNNGGKVVNKKTVITSKAANYYTDIKDVIFMKDVLVNDPAYNITTDSLLYNTDNQVTRFITYTTIRDSANRTIKTKEGFYNLKTGDAEFGQRSMVNDNNKTTIIADSLTLSEEFAQAKGQAVVVDSVRGTIIIADLIYQNRISEAVLATRNPLMIIKQENDSIYVTADTLFTAKLTDLYASRSVIGKTTGDSLQEQSPQMTPDSASHIPSAPDILEDSTKILNDSLPETIAKTDSTLNVSELAARTDSTVKAPLAKNVAETDPAKEPPPLENQTGKVPTDLPQTNLSRDSATAKLQTPKMLKDSIALNDSTNRYFEAFHNVKIFSDSMQALSDSLFYSFRDSTFRLYQNPVVWGQDNNQITGDTLLLHTKNKQPYRFEAIKNAFMLSHIEREAFNQIRSSRLDGFFTNGNLDSVKAKGSTEAIYYLQDDDSAYTGINQSTSDMMDAYLVNKQLKKIVLRGQPKGTIFPIRQKTPKEMQLKGFNWREAERPKTKYDLL